jgi:hypothetical protein
MGKRGIKDKILVLFYYYDISLYYYCELLLVLDELIFLLNTRYFILSEPLKVLRFQFIFSYQAYFFTIFGS